MTENWGKRDTSLEKNQKNICWSKFVFELDFGEIFI